MNENILPDRLLTLKEASQYLRVSTVFIYHERKKGAISVIKAGKKVLIRQSSLDAYLKSKGEVTNE